MSTLSRRTLLRGLGGFGSVAALAACSTSTQSPVTGPASPAGPSRPGRTSPQPGGGESSRRPTARPATVDLGGPVVSTWADDDALPGPLIRANAGDLIRVRLTNRLPAETTVHWHGIRLANAADGVPGLTQNPIGRGDAYTYAFMSAIMQFPRSERFSIT